MININPNDKPNIIADFVGLDRKNVVSVEHHWCHAYYAYFSPIQ